MARLDSWVEREYGRNIVKDRFLFTAFAIAFTIVTAWWLLPLLIANNDTLLAKTGTTASIIGVFIGTYITAWLINQNHIRWIKENFFYKVGLSTDVGVILEAVITFNTWIETINRNKIDVEMIKAEKHLLMEHFNHCRNRIETINSNTFVPAGIRQDSDLILLQVINPITKSLRNLTVRGIAVKDKLPDYQEGVFSTKYFTNDRSEIVQTCLQNLKATWNKIEKLPSI